MVHTEILDFFHGFIKDLGTFYGIFQYWQLVIVYSIYWTWILLICCSFISSFSFNISSTFFSSSIHPVHLLSNSSCASSCFGNGCKVSIWRLVTKLVSVSSSGFIILLDCCFLHFSIVLANGVSSSSDWFVLVSSLLVFSSAFFLLPSLSSSSELLLSSESLVILIFKLAQVVGRAYCSYYVSFLPSFFVTKFKNQKSGKKKWGTGNQEAGVMIQTLNIYIVLPAYTTVSYYT